MQNIIKKLGQTIFHNFFRKLFSLIVFLGLSFAFLPNNALAQASPPLNASTFPQVDSQDTQLKNKTAEINDFFLSISRFVFALLWPVLFIAGIALDNSLVYGSFLHIDASLWTLRNIMKNFANFGLGFLVLFSIVRNIFTSPFDSKGGKDWGPVSIIKKTLIAGILIQASRFLVAVLIDLSTILIYSIGGMPMTVMQTNPDFGGNMPIIGINTTLSTNSSDLSEGKSAIRLDYYNTYANKKLSPCRVMDDIPNLNGSYIVGREKILVESGVFFETGYCTMGGWPYRYQENYGYNGFYQGDDPITNEGYKVHVKAYFGNNLLDSDSLLTSCAIIHTNPSYLNSNCKGSGYGGLSDNDPFFTVTDGSAVYKMGNLIDKSKGFVGPLITMYSSLLNFGELSMEPPEDTNVVASFFELTIKLFFALALFVPLLILTVVLIGRIAILWLIIVASPILVLLGVFKDVLKFGKGGGDDSFLKHFQLSEIMKLIFAPVFVVFAISMSIIFLSSLNNVYNKPVQSDSSTNTGARTEFNDSFGISKVVEENNKETYTFLWGLIETTLDVNKFNYGMDTFAWIIVKLFTVGIIRFFVFFAIKLTKLGSSIASPIQKSVQDLVKNLPLIPLPGGGTVGFSAAKEGLGKLGDKIPTQLRTSQQELLREKYPWLYGSGADEKRGEESFAKLSDSDRNKILGDIKIKPLDQVFKTHQATLSAAGISSVESLASTFNTYAVNNMTSITNNEFIGNSIEDENKINTFMAEAFTAATVENMIRGNEDWTNWAKTAVGTNVKTRDGVRVLVNEGVHTNPNFKLLTIEDYNKKYLPQNEAGELNKDKLKEELEERYSRIEKSDESNSLEWKKEAGKWVEEQLKAHQAQADKRIKAQSKSSQSIEKSAEE